MPDARPLTTYVTDEAGIMDPARVEKLKAQLADFEKVTSTQIAVATYPRSPAVIEEFTIAVAERSRLGGKGQDNGAILFVFKEGRSARLEIGYGLEGVLTDAGSHRILEEKLAPAFARGDYDGGIAATVDAVLLTAKDAYDQGRMPGGFAVMWQQVKSALPKLLPRAFPALVELGFLPRLLASFFGGVFATIGCYVAREVVRNVYFFARMLAGKKVQRISFDAMLENLKLMGFALEVVVGSAGFGLAALAAVAGIVIVASGGSFGGAGAAIRW
jgi:uncharacterized protein